MKAVIKLDVPEWQIGQETTVYFPDTMMKHGICQKDEIVRCKDCKHAKLHGIDAECTAHEEIGYDPEPWHPLDWFCADGERR